MNKRTLNDLKNIEGKIVLTRVDFNVPFKEGQISDVNRIKASLPTIKYLIDNKAKVVLFTHLGRISTEEDKVSNSVKLVSEKLEELSGMSVKFVPFTRGEVLEKEISLMENGTILMFENTRFEDVKNGELIKLESKNDSNLGKYWASLGDIFINDAFGTSHRTHASNVGIASNIKESAIGFLVEKEVKFLHDAITNPQRPFVALLGGAKISDKINVIESLLNKADKVIIGTAMSYTFNLAKGMKIGASLVETSKMELAKDLMEKYKDKLIIVTDSVCVDEFVDKPGETFLNIPDGLMGMDIGPESIELVKRELKGAKTVLWNGPFGVAEFKNFEKGTRAVAEAIISLEDATTIIGGGDSAAAAIKFGMQDKFTHISTGGGSSVEFIEGKELPGISSVQDK